MTVSCETLPVTSQVGQPSARDRLQQHGKSFHFAGQFLSHNHLDDAARLYAFCRVVDDGVDQAADTMQAGRHLERIAHDLDRGESRDPDVQAFLTMAGRKSMDLAVAHQLLEGQRSDLAQVRINADTDLKRYSYRVAGTVGIMMCNVLHVTDPRASCFAIDLGVAMQLTNIVRDIREDAMAGRIYLPATLIGSRSPEWVVDQTNRNGPDLRDAARHLLDEADRYYASGEAGLAFLPPRARLAILIAARLYHAIGDRIRHRHYAIGTHRAVVSQGGKARIAAATVRAYLVRNRFRDLPGPHRADLHRGFAGLPGAEPATDTET